MINYTHKDIIDIGYKWIMGRCAFAFKDLVTVSSEIPDIIGFNSTGSFLLEAKVSRIDFLKDNKKDFRINSWMGMGDWRFYIAPKGLIKVNELPENWGLIEVNENRKARTVHNPFGKGNIYSHWVKNEKNDIAEKRMMFSALRRLEEKKLIKEIYKTQERR